MHYTIKSSIDTYKCSVRPFPYFQGKRISCSCHGILIHNIPRRACYTQYRCGSVFFTQPLDLIKNRMQLSGKHNDCSVIELLLLSRYNYCKLGQTRLVCDCCSKLEHFYKINDPTYLLSYLCVVWKYIVLFALYISLLFLIDFIQYVALHWMWHPY